MQDRLSKLVGIFEGLDFRANRAHGDDLLGDAYEYLMGHFATQSGKGAIIMPHGVLFRGNREADIRRNLVKRGLIKGVIGLPANLFYGTGIPACIVVIDKENAVGRRGWRRSRYCPRNPRYYPRNQGTEQGLNRSPVYGSTCRLRSSFLIAATSRDSTFLSAGLRSSRSAFT